jgi:hypothetical protein
MNQVDKFYSANGGEYKSQERTNKELKIFFDPFNSGKKIDLFPVPPGNASGKALFKRLKENCKWEKAMYTGGGPDHHGTGRHSQSPSERQKCR